MIHLIRRFVNNSLIPLNILISDIKTYIVSTIETKIESMYQQVSEIHSDLKNSSYGLESLKSDLNKVTLQYKPSTSVLFDKAVTGTVVATSNTNSYFHTAKKVMSNFIPDATGYIDIEVSLKSTLKSTGTAGGYGSTDIFVVALGSSPDYRDTTIDASKTGAYFYSTFAENTVLEENTSSSSYSVESNLYKGSTAYSSTEAVSANDVRVDSATSKSKSITKTIRIPIEKGFPVYIVISASAYNNYGGGGRTTNTISGINISFKGSLE